MKVKVLYEDGLVLVINKPAGVVVNRAQSVRESTLQDWIEEKFDFPLARKARERNGIVHRLDKETSGVMVIAKTSQVLNELCKQFKAREVKKSYLALVHGLVKPKEGSIALPLARRVYDRERFGVSVKGKASVTFWKVLDYFDDKKGKYRNGKFSLLELSPQTGRTHQLRVHLAHLAHPIVGDGRYLSKRLARLDRQWCPRQFLHAATLTIIHPETRKKIKYEAKLPIELSKALSNLGK